MQASDYSFDAAEDVCRQYADVLRAGKLRANGELVSWNTNTSTELQLVEFHAAFMAKIYTMPSLISDMGAACSNAPYWFCKAVSFNYVLIEVLKLLQRKTDAVCTIQTRSSFGGSLVEYSVDFLQGGVMRVCITFNGQGNVVFHDPANAETQVKGTLSSLKAEIRVPPKPDFSPVYSLGLSLDAASNFFNRLERMAKPTVSVSVREALVFRSPFETSVERKTSAKVKRAYNPYKRSAESTSDDPQKRVGSKVKATQEIATKVLSATIHGISFTGSNACSSGHHLWTSCRLRSCSNSANAQLLPDELQRDKWPRLLGRSPGAVGSIRSLSQPISRAVGKTCTL
jgi:hypothetical protein